MVTALSLTAFLASASSNWCAAVGRMRFCYSSGCVAGVAYFLVNIVLASRGDWGVLWLALPSAWLTITSAVGLRRLARERQQGTELHPSIH